MSESAGKTLIISCNDREAHEIQRLAVTSRFAHVDLGLAWGGLLDPSDPNLVLDRLGRVVVLVEVPSPDFERLLRDSGRVVHIIDHHLYITPAGEVLDRRSPRSSLEQFAALCGISLDPTQRLIAANDRGFWLALIATAKADGLVQPGIPVDTDAVVLEAIWAIRREDLACRIQNSDTREKLVDGARAFLDTAEANGKLRGSRLRPR